ncbi:MAG: hypothetical protein ACRDBY_08625 [Cetobacterium sp.]
MLKRGKQDIDEFIKEHNHIRYCEAIIDEDGLIEYAVPSHVMLLERYTGIDRDTLYFRIMPMTELPIKWLVNYTKCVSVWYGYFVAPSCGMNEKQQEVLNKLIEADIVSKDIEPMRFGR